MMGRPARAMAAGTATDAPVRLWERSCAFSRNFGRTGTCVETISAIDIGLWHI